nr:MAG TPA: hypothetical protein [Caudoviricetes sp.]
MVNTLVVSYAIARRKSTVVPTRRVDEMAFIG